MNRHLHCGGIETQRTTFAADRISCRGVNLPENANAFSFRSTIIFVSTEIEIVRGPERKFFLPFSISLSSDEPHETINRATDRDEEGFGELFESLCDRHGSDGTDPSHAEASYCSVGPDPEVRISRCTQRRRIFV